MVMLRLPVSTDGRMTGGGIGGIIMFGGGCCQSTLLGGAIGLKGMLGGAWFNGHMVGGIPIGVSIGKTGGGMLRGMMGTTAGATMGSAGVGADHFVFLGLSRDLFFSTVPSDAESSDVLRSRLRCRWWSVESDSLSLLVELPS